MEEDTKIRLGKIEKFLLLYALRQKKNKTDYVSRSSAMWSFVRFGPEGPDLVPTTLFHPDGTVTREVRLERRTPTDLPLRKVLPLRDYRSAQVRITTP